MSQPKFYPLPQDFVMQTFVDEFVRTYQAQGYIVVPAPIDRGATLLIDKPCSSFGRILGLDLGLRVTFTVVNDSLVVTVNEEKWVSKIICIAVGYIFCLVPMITGIIGAVKQDDLSSSILQNVTRLIECS